MINHKEKREKYVVITNHQTKLKQNDKKKNEMELI